MTDQTSPTGRLAAGPHPRRAGAVGIRRGSPQLQEEFGVTPVTLRRDLQQLEQEGLLVRVHGGAVPPAGGMPPRASATGSATIGMLVPSLDFYWPNIVRAVEADARNRGMSVLLRGASYELQDERPALRRMIEQTELAGLIVAPNTRHRVLAGGHRLARRLRRAVRARRARRRLPPGRRARRIRDDGSRARRCARRAPPGTARPPQGGAADLAPRLPTSRKVIAGWTTACRELGLTPAEHVERVLPDRGDPKFSKTVDGVLDAVLTAGVTALLVHSDREAMAIIDLALARGLQVPGDLSVIAYDDEVAELFTPALTAVSPPRAGIGRAALDLLLARIAHPDRPAHRVILNPSLHVRDSTAPPR